MLRSLQKSGELEFAEGEDGELLGFVCGTLSREGVLSEASMGEHTPEGLSLCIHSVVIDRARRRGGLGRAMLRAYLEQVAAAEPQLARALLICKEHLLGFYGLNGFELVGPSRVVHGQDPWFEMVRPLP